LGPVERNSKKGQSSSWAVASSEEEEEEEEEENIRFEVFTAVTMKNAVFWVVAPYRYCINQSFGGMYHIHLQGRRKKKKNP
jgi:hypothetical protein